MCGQFGEKDTEGWCAMEMRGRYSAGVFLYDVAPSKKPPYHGGTPVYPGIPRYILVNLKTILGTFSSYVIEIQKWNLYCFCKRLHVIIIACNLIESKALTLCIPVLKV